MVTVGMFNLPQDVASFDHKITNETRCLSQNNFKTHQPSSQDYSNLPCLNITQLFLSEITIHAI